MLYNGNDFNFRVLKFYIYDLMVESQIILMLCGFYRDKYYVIILVIT